MTIIRQWQRYELTIQSLFLVFKHALTIMCECRFAIKPMFLSCATHQINKSTLQQQLF